MDLLRKARDLEARSPARSIGRVGDFVQSGAREPLEIVHAIVEARLAQMQSSGRGRRVFPFNALAVTVLAASRDARARFEAVVRRRPAPARPHRPRACAPPAARSTHLDVIDRVRDSRGAEALAEPGIPPRIPARSGGAAGAGAGPGDQPVRDRADGAHGAAAAAHLLRSRAATRIDLGRCAEVRDSQHRLIRTNHIAFIERRDDVNQTVSRRHAHISYEESPHQQFRLHDDGSEHGTGIVRDGRTVPVPRGSRGVRLDSRATRSSSAKRG